MITFSCLAESFIQSGLQCVQRIIFSVHAFLGIKPRSFELPAPQSTSCATAKAAKMASLIGKREGGN